MPRLNTRHCAICNITMPIWDDNSICIECELLQDKMGITDLKDIPYPHSKMIEDQNSDYYSNLGVK